RKPRASMPRRSRPLPRSSPRRNRTRTSKRSSRPMPSHSMHPTPPTSLPRLPELRRATRARYALALLGIVFVGAATTAAGPAQAGSAQRTRVTVIGDSVSESLDYVPAAKRYLGRGLDLRSSVVVCRRLVAASCAFQGTQPSTALEYVTAQLHALLPPVAAYLSYTDCTATSH